MKAVEARQLKKGDWVIGCFGNHRKKCQVIASEWPKILVGFITSRGKPEKRWRTYRSLTISKMPGNNPIVKTLPSWLVFERSDNEVPNGQS